MSFKKYVCPAVHGKCHIFPPQVDRGNLSDRSVIREYIIDKALITPAVCVDSCFGSLLDIKTPVSIIATL